jgi:hypothetical protein
MRHPVTRPETCSEGVPDGQEFGLIVLNSGFSWLGDVEFRFSGVQISQLGALCQFEGQLSKITSILIEKFGFDDRFD